MWCCFVYATDMFCNLLHAELMIVVSRSTSSIRVYRDQGLSNNLVVKFIVEFDKLFQQAGEASCTTSNFLQWVRCQ